ncbi:MAG: ABC transporter substrate-binding protein [Nitrososphaerales archaeon]|nr:ABC transporter substrate-binding protein [Nitrososphaerales archaeon]
MLTKKKHAISNTVAAIIVIVVLVVGAGATYFFVASTARTTTVTSTSTSISTTTSTASSTSTTTSLPTPSFVTGNTLVYETPANFEWLDPNVQYYQADAGIVRNAFETLFWYNGTNAGQVIPWLVSGYTVSPDGKTWTMSLRHGINFADGTPLNATAVWFSLNRLLIMDGTSGSGVHGSQAAWIIQQLLNTSLSSSICTTCYSTYDAKWVQTVLAQNFVTYSNSDPYTVKLNLVHPSASTPFLLAGEWASIMSPSWVVAHDLKAAITGPHTINYTKYFGVMAGNGTGPYMNLPKAPVFAGSGPYTITSVNPTTYNVVLTANPNYWGGPPGFALGTIGKAKIPTIQWNYIPDVNTRILDLKTGKATLIDVGAADIYSVADRSSWLGQGQLNSIIPGATIYGTYPTYITGWFEFSSNITTAAGNLRPFQPFSDLRFRQAVITSVNITSLLINVGNRLSAPATQLVPPNLAPTGSHDPTIPWPSYNLTSSEAMLKSAKSTPLTSFHYYNGTKIPAGRVNNTFGPNNPQTIQLVYVAGGTLGQNIVTQIAGNLNAISVRDKLGLTFTVTPLPSGQRYTLMSRHQLDFAPAGWQTDYNWVTDWTGPMYLSTQTYFSWSLWNNTGLDKLVHQIFDADSAGNITLMVSLVRQANVLANSLGYYMWNNYPLFYQPASTWLKGYAYNPGIGDPGYFFPTYSFAPPS